MIAVEPCPHPEIEAFLAHDPRTHVFPLYVCAARPEGRSLAAVQGDRIVGAVVAGRAFGLPHVASGWLFAEHAEAALALVRALDERGRLDGLQLPWEGAGALLHGIPGFRATLDVYLTRPPGPPPEVRPTGRLVQVDERAVRTLDMPPEIRAAVGDLRDLPAGAELWGLEQRGRLVALADTLVRYGDVVTVQQVFTAPSERRQGHSRSLLGQLLALPFARRDTLTWLASAENQASIALASGLGFGEPVHLACVARAG